MTEIRQAGSVTTTETGTPSRQGGVDGTLFALGLGEDGKRYYDRGDPVGVPGYGVLSFQHTLRRDGQTYAALNSSTTRYEVKVADETADAVRAGAIRAWQDGAITTPPAGSGGGVPKPGVPNPVVAIGTFLYNAVTDQKLDPDRVQDRLDTAVGRTAAGFARAVGVPLSYNDNPARPPSRVSWRAPSPMPSGGRATASPRATAKASSSKRWCARTAGWTSRRPPAGAPPCRPGPTRPTAS